MTKMAITTLRGFGQAATRAKAAGLHESLQDRQRQHELLRRAFRNQQRESFPDFWFLPLEERLERGLEVERVSDMNCLEHSLQTLTLGLVAMLQE